MLLRTDIPEDLAEHYAALGRVEVGQSVGPAHQEVEEVRQQVEGYLKMYLGTHNFHNFTTKKPDASDSSFFRKIEDVQVETFFADGAGFNGQGRAALTQVLFKVT